MRPSLLPAVLALAGCATLAPRFEQDVATTFAQDDMRKLVTPELEVYYPAQHAAAARQVAARAAECLKAFRGKARHPRPPGRALLFLTSANYNNAYVGGQSLGEPLHAVNPLSVTSELFHWYGLGGASAGDIACHEMFHVAHYEQTHGFWRTVNTVLGPVFPPQTFLERWFTEGVAQYYEGRVGRRVGRPYSPLYRGAFESFVAMRGGAVEAGDLSLLQRELNPFGGAYLAGAFFVEWLVERHGEDKLWQVMELQGRSVLSPLGATLRVKDVYGRSVGALVDEWAAELASRYVPRPRPAAQAVLRDDVGQLARLASHPGSGTLALVSSGNEEVPTLRILEPDGRVRVETRLVRLGTDRDWVYAGPGTMSGLSFSEDGRWLYLLNDDLIERGDTRAQLWRIDAHTGEVLQVTPGLGRSLGGTLSPGGRAYTRVDLSPGAARIIERDLETGRETVLVDLPPGISAAAPAWDPAHRRLAFSRQDGNGWNLVVREPDGQLREVTRDGAFTSGARWLDGAHVVAARSDGRVLQAQRIDVDTGACEPLSAAPFGVIDVALVPGGVAFLNRVDARWSLDRVPLEPPAAREAPATSWTPSPAGAAPPLPEAPPLRIERDEPSSPLERLFVPQLRVPGVVGVGGSLGEAGLEGATATLSLSLMGRDRLGRHTWAVDGTLTVPDVAVHTLWVGYRNLSLAPWALSATASKAGFRDESYWSARVAASRSVFSVPLALGVQAEVWQPYGQRTERFVGPALSLSYFAGDATAYAGVQRALGFDLDLAAYPRLTGSERDLLDVRAGVTLAFPLPGSKRHAFVLAGTGRSLPGAPEGALRVGGVPSLNTLFQRGNSAPFPQRPGTFLPGTLVEGVRGFDDFAVRARHAFVAGARYRYAFVIDRGFASTLWVFPSFFLRQVDVEGFGSAFFTDSPAAPVGRALGAALSVRTAFAGSLPVSLTYQFAWRFDFGLPPLHLVGLSFD